MSKLWAVTLLIHPPPPLHHHPPLICLLKQLPSNAQTGNISLAMLRPSLQNVVVQLAFVVGLNDQLGRVEAAASLELTKTSPGTERDRERERTINQLTWTWPDVAQVQLVFKKCEALEHWIKKLDEENSVFIVGILYLRLYQVGNTSSRMITEVKGHG